MTGVAILQAVEEVTHVTIRDAKPVRPMFRGDAHSMLTVDLHTRRGVVSLYLKGTRDVIRVVDRRQRERRKRSPLVSVPFAARDDAP